MWAPVALEEMTPFFPQKMIQRLLFSTKKSSLQSPVRWTEHALCLSHNIRTRVYKLSLPNFQWITNVPWKLRAAQHTGNKWETHISLCCTRISPGAPRIGRIGRLYWRWAFRSTLVTVLLDFSWHFWHCFAVYVVCVLCVLDFIVTSSLLCSDNILFCSPVVWRWCCLLLCTVLILYPLLQIIVNYSYSTGKLFLFW